MKLIIAASLIFTVIATLSVYSSDGAIGADLVSTLQLVGALCRGGKDEPGVPEAFFGCFDLTPAKFIFEECQVAIFGGVLDDLEEITESCCTMYEILTYSGCLQLGFDAAGLNMTEAVTVVNVSKANNLPIIICQGEVLGLE